MTMITVQPPVKAANLPPHPLFQIMLKERYRIGIQLLDQLTACSRMPDRGGYEPAALAAMLTWASGGVADSANALQRISEGTYGPCERCGRDIPLGRLRMQPDARYCVSCERFQATDPVSTRRQISTWPGFTRTGQRTATSTAPRTSRRERRGRRGHDSIADAAAGPRPEGTLLGDHLRQLDGVA